MNKLVLSSLLISCSLSTQASVILQNGDSYSTAFTMQSMPDFYKLTDNYWESILELVDSANPPYEYNGSGSVTLTLYENTDYTHQVFSWTEDSSNWMADYGIPFWGNDGLFNDLDGSLTVTYNGAGSAELHGIHISNFAGVLAPSNVARTSIYPTAVPVPAALWLMLSGIGALGFLRKNKACLKNI